MYSGTSKLICPMNYSRTYTEENEDVSTTAKVHKSKSLSMQKFKYPKYFKSKRYVNDSYEEKEEPQVQLSTSNLDMAADDQNHKNHKLCKKSY